MLSILRIGGRVALAALLLVAPVAPGALAQDQLIASPILTLDQERLFNGSRVAERVSAEIERRTEDLAAENRRIEAQLVAEELDLTERRATLAPTEFRALADDFDARVQGIREAQDAKARELQRLRDEERNNFLRQITPLLAEIVRERGAVVVIDRRSVFLSAESIDITEEAITRINEAFDQESPSNPLDLSPGVEVPQQPEQQP